jgi:hypothetical protein
MNVQEAAMSVNRVRCALAAMAIVLIGGAAASAQERPAEFDNYVIPGWSFTPGLSISGVWDSNVTLQGPAAITGETPNDTVFLIVPSGQFELASPRTNFHAGYRGYWRRHQELGQLDGFDQRAYVSLQHAFTPRVSWSINNEFSKLPTTDLLQMFEVPFRRIGSRANFFGTGVDTRLTKYTDLRVRYENTWTSFDRVDEFLNAGTIHGFRADVRRRLSERTTLGAEGRLRRSDVSRDDPRVIWFRDAGAMFDYRLSEYLTLNLVGGFSHLQSSRADESETSPYYRLGLQHATDRARMGVELQQSYMPSFGFSGTNNTRELRGFVHMPFSRNRLYVQADASWRRSDPYLVAEDAIIGLDAGEVRLDTFYTQVTVGYSARRWLRVEGYHTYSKQDSLIPGEPIQRHRIGTQLVVSQPMRIR